MLDEILNVTLIQTTIRAATPIVLASMGGLLTYQANILNIGLEGMILMGALFGVIGSYFMGSSFAGVMLAVLVGIIVSLVYGFFVITLKSDEFIIGIATNIFAMGFTVYLLRSIFGVTGVFSSGDIVPLPRVSIPLLENSHYLNAIFNNHSIFIYLSWLFVILIFIFLYKTPWGMWIRVAGEYPEALETAGVSATKMKHISSVLCGIMCAMAGAHLSLGYLTMFTENMSADRGWIAIAAVIFGRANPILAFLAAMLFGFSSALGTRLQAVDIPSQLTLMLPYIATIIALFIVAKRRLARGEAEE